MSKREKLLAAAVGGLLVLMVLGYGLKRLSGMIVAKRQAVFALQNEVRDKRRTAQFGMEHRERLDGYEAMSLPSDPNVARTEYQRWLLGAVTETVELTDPQVNVLATRSDNEVYHLLNLSVTGMATLPQLVDFLYHFYSADILHRIRRLHIKRIPDSKHLDVSVYIEAIALRSAPAERELDTTPAHHLTKGTKSDYLATILERNLSGMQNSPPELSLPDSATAYLNESFEMKISGRDADRLDRVKYALDGDELFGAEVDEESGRFRWRPEEPGEYQFVVMVTDDGIPARTTRETLEINVTERPAEAEPVREPEKPSFDLAQFVYVTGITEVGDRRQAWVGEPGALAPGWEP
jgi:hypothetical protein